MALLPTDAERVAEAADGAIWTYYDRRHKLLFVGRVTWETGHMVHTLDLTTCKPWDEPWPVAPETVERLGIKVAFSSAVKERVNQGY